MAHHHTTAIVYVPGKPDKKAPKADVEVFVDKEVKVITIARHKPKDRKGMIEFDMSEVRNHL